MGASVSGGRGREILIPLRTQLILHPPSCSVERGAAHLLAEVADVASAVSHLSAQFRDHRSKSTRHQVHVGEGHLGHRIHLAHPQGGEELLTRHPQRRTALATAAVTAEGRALLTTEAPGARRETVGGAVGEGGAEGHGAGEAGGEDRGGG